MFCLLLLGTVLSTMRLILHAFEHTPLLNNVEEKFGNRSSFESQRVRVQANMADLNSVLAQGEKERPLRELCFSQFCLAQNRDRPLSCCPTGRTTQPGRSAQWRDTAEREPGWVGKVWEKCPLGCVVMARRFQVTFQMLTNDVTSPEVGRSLTTRFWNLFLKQVSATRHFSTNQNNWDAL